MAVLLAILAQCIFAPALGSGYDEALAERMVIYSGAAYCAGQAPVASWDCYACRKAPGFQNATSVHDATTDGRGIVGYDSTLGARVVAFMGTNINVHTWIDDLKSMEKAPYRTSSGCEGCEVGKGFLDYYNGVRDQVWTALQALPPGKTYITGHSLGATVATICAIDLLEARGLRADQVITFGQPRVGNKDFANYYGRTGLSLYRVTHHRDPIPHWPLEALGYSHVTQEVYYVDAGASAPTRICDNLNGEDPKCSDQFDGNAIFIADHWEYLKFSFAADVIHCTVSQETITV